MSQQALERMIAHLGTDYLWGGECWDIGVDCSGAVRLAYGRTGPDQSAEAIRRSARPLSWEEAAPGDPVFLLRAGRAFHVVLFVGWEQHSRGRRAVVVGASGGDHTTTTRAAARARNACVRFDLYNTTSKTVEVRRWT